jgi:hypothetical protein
VKGGVEVGLHNKIKLLSQISWCKFVYYNFISKQVERRGRAWIIPYRNAVINLAPGAKIIIENGDFLINANKPSGTHAEAYVTLRKNARLLIHGMTQLNYRATIEVHENAEIDIGSAYINSDAVILAAESIRIGYECLISRMVYIYDADHHDIVNADGKVINPPRPVIVGNHVWIGLQSLLLRGSKIGDGAVIAANSLVGGKIKAGTMASGNPARSYAEILWKG